MTGDALPGARLIGVFTTEDALSRAVESLQANAHDVVETWAPYDIEALDRIRRRPRSRLTRAGLAGGMLGGVVGAVVLWWTNARAYPLDVGARPLIAIPAWIPITFESTVLLASVSLFVALCIRLGLPRLWAPIDEVDGFSRASVDEFWVAIAVPDDATAQRAESALAQLQASRMIRW